MKTPKSTPHHRAAPGLCLLPLLFALTAGAAANYEQPAVLTGNIYEAGSGTNQLLYTFKRTATRSNSETHVLRDFLYPNGALAARETIVFQQGELVSFTLDEKQTGAHGRSVVARSGGNGSKRTLQFAWNEGSKAKTDSEAWQADTIVADMLPYFIASHWNQLAREEHVHLRFIVPSRLETVGFKLVRESEVSWHGKEAVRVRMEPSSVIIRQLVEPLFFIVEKAGEHHILEYVGRTTPKRRDGAKWKDLDARTIYSW